MSGDAVDPPLVSRTDDRDPTYMTGHARTTTEHEVASTSAPGQQTGPPQQADLQGEPTTSPRPPEVAPFDSPFYELCEDPDCPDAYAFRSPHHPGPHYHYTGTSSPEPSRWADL